MKSKFDNSEWYYSLSAKDKNELNAKKRLAGLKGSQIASIKKQQEKQNRQKLLLSLPFGELTQKEKRQRIDIEQDGKCSECRNTPHWNGKPLKFELDHIDGNRFDNSRNNLRLLCPNCHSQTPTFKVGNNKNVGKKTYADEEIIQSLLQNTSGYTAMKALGMNPHGGNYTRIRKLIKEKSLQLSYNV